MDTTTLQVPLTKSLKSSATAVVKEYGFSSLQEVVRVFLTKLARRELAVNINSIPIQLSKRAERRYSTMDEDFRKEKNICSASEIGDLMTQLSE